MPGFTAVSLVLLTLAGQPASVDFTRDVRPILADKCFACHGFDDKTRKAGLRLDERDGAIKVLRSGAMAIVPGHPEKSEVVARITSKEPREVMPPPKFNKPLSAREIDLLTRWIQQGAPYVPHWAYVTPRRPTLPAVKNTRWPRNPVDVFLLARIEKEGLAPSPEADRAALLRRVSLDLTGLPPTLEEADRFLHDPAPDAYEKLVDRLLASPAYGERWASPWLDLARYADSQGFANDPDRTIWPYRDWVIQALNGNLSYDQFTIWQLAGDLLPRPTPEQLVATGFHRNTLTNTEGGTNPEEFRSAAVVDRVNTTFQVWMGSTLACAQCHNHKYDPFSQKEYYQIYAIFNSSEDANRGDDAPNFLMPMPGRERDYADLTARLAEKRVLLQKEIARLDAALPAWLASVDRAKLPKPIADILAVEEAKRKPQQKQQLLEYYRSQTESYRSLNAEIKQLEARQKQLAASSPILREIKPRPTHIHIRGDFLDKGDLVQPGLPAVFSQLRVQGKIDRLALANWIVDPRNPLTARVAVNRLWEELFGIGIVETSEEFGLQGELPEHPELLDWLATEYIRIGWDTKALLRLLVTSAAYRQTGQVSDELNRRDPRNRLLARGPRIRLSAEAIRDQALFVSGLLSRKMFGPPVQPPRPSFGLSAAFGSGTDWVTSAGEDRYRRGLYTRWRRNAPYPSATTFDAPERTFCSIRRIRTNTPLQALVTLNDPVFFEAAQALARRIVSEVSGDVRARLRHAFRLVLTRLPTEPEIDRLAQLFEAARQKYASKPAEALALATKPIGPLPAGLDAVELAAWTVVGNVLLNLDETLVKR